MNLLINKRDKIFIAGSQGMVGSSIKRGLIKSGYGQKSLGGELFGPTRKELDLCNFQEVEQWFIKNKPNVVIIAAAKVGGIYANSSKPYDFILNNLKIQTNIIELAWKYNVRRLLFLGSSCIYPKDSPQPIKEEYLLKDYLETTNEFYAIAKIAGIKLCQSLRIQNKFDAICLMPTNLYGPGDNYDHLNSHVIPGLIKKFIEAKKENLKYVKCWGTGKALREFLYVDDLAEACIFTLERWDPNYQNSNKNPCWLNIGSDYEISINNLAYKISNLVGFNGEIRWDADMPDGTMRKKLDTSKVNSLGWKAKTNLDLGLKLTIDNLNKDIFN
tara:strand:+ start:11533 stop:12519 length:987 start_codon:yes stop_codon:yes gene_type:complete